jgi:hypothetical protein
LLLGVLGAVLLFPGVAHAKEAFLSVEGGYGLVPRVTGALNSRGQVVPMRIVGCFHGDSGLGAEYGMSFPRFWLDAPETDWPDPPAESRTLQGLNAYGGPSLWLHDRVVLSVPMQGGVAFVSATETDAAAFLSAAGQIRAFFVPGNIFPLTLALATEASLVVTPGTRSLRMLSVYATLGLWIPTQ